MTVRNDIDRFHLVGDVIDRVPSLGYAAAYIKQFIQLMIVFVFSSSCWAQQYEAQFQMLIETVAGRTYQRNTFEADGELTNRSTIRVGPLLTELDGSVTVTIDIEFFTASGEQESKQRLNWSCDPSSVGMFMNILILAGGDLNRDMRLEVDGPALLYPVSANTETVFNDVVLYLQVREGFLSLLGTKTRLFVTNRRAQTSDSLRPGSYTVESEVKAKVYVMGIPVKRQRFRSFETIQKHAGLIYQRIVFPNGRYITIEQIGDSTAEPTG